MNAIYAIGSSNTDMVVKCKRLPKPGETVLGGQFIQAHGGKGANQAVAAARLGGNVKFLCRVGDDAFGKQSIEAYRNEGIDVERVIVDSSGPSGIALILVDESGENSIAVASGVNANVTPNDVEILNELLKPSDIVLMQLEIPVETVIRAAEIARTKDATVILDPAPAPQNGLPETLYPLLHYILPNECEAAMLLGTENTPVEMAKALQAKGVRHAIVTAGENGAALAAQMGVYEFSAHRVNAVDSTAAGDAFAGAMAVALADGYKTREAIAFAQAAASISVTRMGAQPSLPMRDEVDKIVVHDDFMDSH